MITVKKNVKWILWANLVLCIASIILPNSFLVYNSFYLYGLQGIILITYALRQINRFYQVFTPSFFVLIYYVVNLVFGSYLLPRDFGFQKWYNDDIFNIKYYNVIVLYFLLCNIGLFLIAIKTIQKLEFKNLLNNNTDGNKQFIYTKMLVFLLLLYTVSYFEVYSSFSFQLIIIIIICLDINAFRNYVRYVIYLTILMIAVKFNFENKREVVVILFTILFIESGYSKWEFNLKFKKILAYIFGVIVFFSLILTASVMRGYGGFDKSNLYDSFKLVPEYIGQDLFIDGLTENLEFNYNYGSAVTSMNLILSGKIDYQFGGTIIKVLFLPLPREVAPFKPESMMQIYTKKYQPRFWNEGGSLPVNISCDMFLNFHFFGLFVFVVLWYIMDRLFINIFLYTKQNTRLYSSIFLIINILPLARGSGIEQYLLYYFCILPFLLFYALLRIVVKEYNWKIVK